MKNSITLFAFLLSKILFAQDGKLPIIDMHMHTSKTVYSKVRPCLPEPCDKPPTAIKEISELLPKTIEMMDKYNIVLGFVSSHSLINLHKWKEAYPERFIISPSISDPEQVDLEILRKEYIEGRFQGMGELGTLYNGIPPNIPQMEPIFDLAEEFDVPVLIHLQGIGAPTPKFSIEAGHPELLEKVLKEHPNLRIYLENGGFPFVEETISLMYMYPQVYVDISTITWIIPRKLFFNHLKSLMDAGLGKRIMFGSDQMLWPETIELAVEAINSAEFLTEEQKRDIFYNNAARFLKLSNEEIRKHHQN